MSILLKQKGNIIIYFNAFLAGLLFFGFMTIISFKVNAVGSENNVALLEQGKELFFKGREMIYNTDASFTEVNYILNNSKEVFIKMSDNFNKNYWLAQVEFLIAEKAENSGDKQQAANKYSESESLIRKALKLNSKSSDANRLLADTIMRLTDYKGGFYAMTQGPQAYKLLVNAIKLDPKNYAAMNSLGVYYLCAPAIGGGSADKAIQTLQNALESKDEYDNFISNTWMGKAFQLKKNNRKAAEYYKKALTIYPNSSLVKSYLTEVDVIQ